MKQLRLFVAIYPPPETARALLGALDALSLAEHRLVPPQHVHLTLHFIGNTDHSRIEETAETVRRSTAGLEGFSLSPSRLITLPSRPPARLVAAETDRPKALLETQRRLASRLARSARSRPGDRFRPHLTLCRFSSPARLRVDEALDVEPFAVHRIALMRSTLTHEGAVHDEVVSSEFA